MAKAVMFNVHLLSFRAISTFCHYAALRRIQVHTKSGSGHFGHRFTECPTTRVSVRRIAQLLGRLRHTVMAVQLFRARQCATLALGHLSHLQVHTTTQLNMQHILEKVIMKAARPVTARYRGTIRKCDPPLIHNPSRCWTRNSTPPKISVDKDTRAVKLVRHPIGAQWNPQRGKPRVDQAHQWDRAHAGQIGQHQQLQTLGGVVGQVAQINTDSRMLDPPPRLCNLGGRSFARPE